jgi:thioesterase domain-containing protein
VQTQEDRPIAAPRDALEDELVALWQELLGVGPVSIYDDFFDLGGHSLLAAAMVARVAERFDRSIPVALLLKNPTLAGFADGLVRTSRENLPNVVPVRITGNRPPLFFLHGDFNAGGLYSARLSRGLTDQPFYAVEPIGSSGTQTPASIEEMAARHAADIREVCPRGPYLLGGHCNGALEALEIARQFRAEKESVPGIVMIQPPPVDRRRRLIDVPVRMGARIASLTEEQRVDLYLRVREVMERIRDRPSESPGIVYRSLRRLVARSASAASEPTDEARRQEPEPSARHDDAVWARYLRAIAAYVPKDYDGSVAALIASEVVNTGADPIAGWRAVGPRFEFHVVPGGHLSCITTHIASTSAAIDAYLARIVSE